MGCESPATSAPRTSPKESGYTPGRHARDETGAVRSREAFGAYAATSPRSLHSAPLSTDNLTSSRAREVTQSSQGGTARYYS
eukprot:368533-Prymnesium_polylepis.1